MLKKLEYQNNAITFDFGNEVEMINATQMAKPFGKNVKDYLLNSQTKKLIEVLEKSPKYSKKDKVQEGNSPLETSETIVKVIHGGRLNGTWMNRILALDFAAWLSPEFHLWIYETIDNMLFGKVKIRQELLDLSSDRMQLASQLKEYEKELLNNDTFCKWTICKKEFSNTNKKINELLDQHNDQKSLFE